MISIYDVLKASKGIHVDDTFAELWGRKLSNAYTVATYHGTLPATLQTVEGYLESYKIYGNTIQIGTPTPQNPVDVNGTGERTANICDMGIPRTINVRNTDVIVGTNQEISVTGTATASGGRNIPISEYINLEAGTYTFSVLGSYTGIGVFFEKKTNNAILCSVIMSNQTGTFTVEEDTECFVGINVTLETTYNATIKIMLNSGETSLPYIPYGYKLPILSNSTVTNIYLGEVETTRRIKKLVLTGEETYNFIRSNTRAYSWYFYPENIGTIKYTAFYCSHGATVTQPENYVYGTVYCDNTVNLGIFPSTFKFQSHVREWLAAQYSAGTPVTIWYVLSEPETGIVNEPLMKIGDYADTVSMEQAGVSIPTSAGSTTISWAGEGLAPSEIELTYRKPKGQ